MLLRFNLAPNCHLPLVLASVVQGDAVNCNTSNNRDSQFVQVHSIVAWAPPHPWSTSPLRALLGTWRNAPSHECRKKAMDEIKTNARMKKCEARLSSLKYACDNNGNNCYLQYVSRVCHKKLKLLSPLSTFCCYVVVRDFDRTCYESLCTLPLRCFHFIKMPENVWDIKKEVTYSGASMM